MGKGDKKTRRGKIFQGSFGKLRPQNKPKTALKGSPIAQPLEKKPKKKTP